MNADPLEIPAYAPLAALTRNGQLESCHRGLIAVSDESGELLFAQGDASTTVFTRSSIKPLQALPLLVTGAAEAWDISDRELALICSSHSGEPEHIETVRKLLERGGLSEDDLVCGPQWPISARASHELWTEGVHEKPSGIYNNCSGKHTGQLLTCKHRGWELEGYHKPDHPLQQMIRGLLAELLELDEDTIGHAYDGCGLSNWAVPLKSLARLFAILGAALHDPADLTAEQSEVLEGIPHLDELRRIARAMSAHPEMVGGSENRFDSLLMPVLDGRGVAKTGAEGIQGTGVAFDEAGRESVTAWLEGHREQSAPEIEGSVSGLPKELRNYLDRGLVEERDIALGIAVKVADGDYRRVSAPVGYYSGKVRALVTLELLDQLGLLDPERVQSSQGLSAFASKARRNTRGERVGKYHLYL